MFSTSVMFRIIWLMFTEMCSLHRLTRMTLSLWHRFPVTLITLPPHGYSSSCSARQMMTSACSQWTHNHHSQTKGQHMPANSSLKALIQANANQIPNCCVKIHLKLRSTAFPLRMCFLMNNLGKACLLFSNTDLLSYDILIAQMFWLNRLQAFHITWMMCASAAIKFVHFPHNSCMNEWVKSNGRQMFSGPGKSN